MILSGWGVSGRAKRQRFMAHLNYAAKIGMLDNASKFIAELREDDWHKCAADDLDWSSDLALAEEGKRREKAISDARKIYAKLKEFDKSAAMSTPG